MALVNVMPDLRASFAYLLRVSRNAKIGLARGEGPGTGSTGAALAWLVVEGGEGELAIGEGTVEVGGREDVFASPGWSALIPPRTRFGVRGNVRYSIVWRAWPESADVRLIRPRAVAEERTGRGVEVRRMRLYVPEGPLICGETLLAPGAWSTWPPHRHEQEEIHLYRFDPSGGIGIQVLDTREGARRGEIVTDGEVRRLRFGHHAAVAAPGATMYYLWTLAGERQTLEPEPDERFA